MADKAIPAVLTGIKQQNFFSAVPAVQVRQHPLVAFGNGEFPAAAGTADGEGPGGPEYVQAVTEYTSSLPKRNQEK